MNSTKIFVPIFIVALTFTMFSCTKDLDSDEVREEIVQIAENRSPQSLLNDLYVGSEGDVEAIARILKCSPSSIERIRNGQTFATPQFAERITEVSAYYYVNGQSFSKLRAALDDEWAWYEDVLYFPKHHPAWFWTINILLLIIGVALVMFYEPGFISIELIIILIEGVLILVCWIISLCISPDMIEDRYTDSINPIIEQVESYE